MNPRLIAEAASTRYSSIRATNGKWIVLQIANGYGALYDAAGNRIDTLPSALHHSAQVVWDWDDPDRLWFVKGTVLGFYNVVTKEITEVRIFDDYTTLTASHAEGDLTRSGYLALVGLTDDATEVCFTYNVKTGVTGTAFPQSEPFDGLRVTESGRLILSRADGIHVLGSPDWYDLTTVNGHSCLGTMNRREKLFWVTAADPQIDANAVMAIDVENTANMTLKVFPWDYALHLSAGPDAVYASCYAPKGNLPFQIWQLALTSGPVLLHEWAGEYHGYDDQPKATYSNGVIHYNRDGAVWQLDLADKVDNSDKVDSEEGLVSDLTPGNVIVWTVRKDRKTFDAHNLLPGGTLEKIDYSGKEGQLWELRPYQGGLRMYRTLT